MAIHNYLINAMNAANETNVSVDGNNALFENAALIWAHMDGEAYGKYNSRTRSVNIVLSDEYAQRLSERGWDVKHKVYEDDNGEEVVLYTLLVTFKYDNNKYPGNMVTVINSYNGKKYGHKIDPTKADDQKDFKDLQDAINSSDYRQCNIGVNGWKNEDGVIKAYLRNMAIEFSNASDDILRSFGDVVFANDFAGDDEKTN